MLLNRVTNTNISLIERYPIRVARGALRIGWVEGSEYGKLRFDESVKSIPAFGKYTQHRLKGHR